MYYINQLLKIFIVLVLAVGSGPSAFADPVAMPSQARYSLPPVQRYRKSIERLIYSHAWAPQGSSDRPIIPYRGARARMTIAQNGSLSDVMLLQSSGKDFSDFYCLEAILTSSPLPKPPFYPPGPVGLTQLGAPLDEVIDFYETSMPDYFHIETPKFSNEGFFASHPELKDSAVILHILPLSTLNYYPDRFTASELSADENIKVIPTHGLLNYGPELTANRTIANPAISQFFKNWEIFVKKHPRATREELLSFRTEQVELIK